MKLKENTMKLSDNTLTLLKNFAGINQSILVKQGNKLRTISIAKNILAEAEITEEFPREFAVYDLNQFLNGLSLHQDPDLDFTENSYITIREGKRRVKYFYADPNVIISPPEKEIKLPEGYYFSWGGQFENMERAMGTLMIIIPLTIAAIFFLLFMMTK